MLRDPMGFRLTRRTFVAGTIASALLVACGGDDEDDTPAATATSEGSTGAEPTATTAESGAEATATEAPAESTSTEEAEAEPTEESQPAATDAELVIGHNVDPTTLNPVDTTSASFQSIFAQIVEQLMIFDSDGATIQPWLAESYEWVDDVTLDLTLKQGVEFSNGEPFNAECVKFTLDQFTASTKFQFFLPVDVYKETEVIDDYTARVHLQRPFAPFLGFLARSVSALPPAYYQEVALEGFGQKPIGTGPFMLDEWVKDSHIKLIRNDAYWDGSHPIATVTYRIIPEPVARIAAFEAGEVQIASYLTTDAVKRLENSDTVDVMVSPGLRKYATHFDTNSADAATLMDPRVRKALNHAVDKQAIAEQVFQGAAVPMKGQWQVEQEPGFNPDIQEFAYDPDLAKQLLADAGFADGFDMQLTYTAGNSPLEKELGEIVASYLQQVGVRVSQRFLEYGAFLTARTESSLGTHQWGLLLPPEPHFNYALFIDGSIYSFHSVGERFTELVDEGTRTTDQAARAEIYSEAAQIMHDDPPMLYLIVPQDIHGVSKKVQGFKPRVDQVLWLYDVSVKA